MATRHLTCSSSRLKTAAPCAPRADAAATPPAPPPTLHPRACLRPTVRPCLPRCPALQADFGLSKTLPINKHAEYGYLDSKFRLTGETGARPWP